MPPHPLVFYFQSSQTECYYLQPNVGACPVVAMDIGAFETQIYPECVVYAFSMFKVVVIVPLVTVEVEKICPGEALALLRLVESQERYYCLDWRAAKL